MIIKDTKYLKEARAQCKWADTSDTKQVERETQDLRAYGGDQWPTDIVTARRGQAAGNGLPAVPERPMLVINKLREPVRQVQNEIRDSDIGVELTPADDFGDLGITPDDTEITLREGLARRIIRNSQGQDAWNWAGDRATIAGRGYFAVLTRYLPGKTNYQEIYLHRIYNQGAVKGDPSRTEPDGRDASFWFLGTWMPWDKFKATYPRLADGDRNPFVDCTADEFEGLFRDYPDWYQSEGDGDTKTRMVRVVDHWYTEYESRELVTFSDGSTVWLEDVPDELPEGLTEIDRRTVVEPAIKVCKIGGGILELERTDWPSKEMPIIEVVGEELHPYDGERRVEGMVHNALGPQMGLNVMASKWVEQVGLTPIPVLQLDPEAIQGYEHWYALLNTRTLPFAPYRTYDDQGRQLAPPQRLNVDPNLAPMAQSVAMFDQAIKSTTAVPDPTLGNVDSSLKSGRAIRETVANAKASTSNFVSNRVRSMSRALEVINSLLYPIYGTTPGRIVRIMTGEGTSESMAVGKPDDAQKQAEMEQRAVKVGKLTEDALFNTAIKVTTNFDTRRQAENSGLGELIGNEPTLMTWFGDLYLGSGDMPNRKQLAERAKVMLAPPIQAMLKAKEEGKDYDPAAQAEIAQLQEQLQMAEKALQELDEERKGKTIENQTKLQIEQMAAQKDVHIEQMAAERDLKLEEMKIAADLEKARMDNATKQYVADLDAKVKGQLQAAEAEHDAMATASAQAHEAEQHTLDIDAQERQADQAQAHDAALAEGGQEHAEQMGERGHEQAMEQQESASETDE